MTWHFCGVSLLLCVPIIQVACSPAQNDTKGAKQTADAPHADHNPRFGGLVLMHGDLHFEVVAQPSGRYRIYFSDELRNELPASTVANVVVTVQRTEEERETVNLRVDDRDASWTGDGRPLKGDSNLRVSYVYRGEPYWIDLPFEGFRASGSP